MHKITASQLNKKTGETLDLVLREGGVGIMRYNHLAALLMRDKPQQTPWEFESVDASDLWRYLRQMLDDCEQGKKYFAILRHGRDIAYLLPKQLREVLGIEFE